jgi:hypothetical protein
MRMHGKRHRTQKNAPDTSKSHLKTIHKSFKFIRKRVKLQQYPTKIQPKFNLMHVIMAPVQSKRTPQI